jgi:protocatechuate 3,4-dioxygenase beta subunit
VRGIPERDDGAYPSRADFFRSDVRKDRRGVPLALTITVVSVNTACTPVASADVEIWQCDVDGAYSQYGSASAATFLRGIQTTDATGRATFTAVYPGWYQGRATHIHVEVTMNGRSVTWFCLSPGPNSLWPASRGSPPRSHG